MKYNKSMRILVAHTKDLFKQYFTNWFDQMITMGNVHEITDDEGYENIIVADQLPTVDDILSYINSFISYYKNTKKNILKYYFIIDAFTKLSKMFQNKVVKFAINIKKLYNLFVKAIQKRISNQMFYLDSVESINDEAQHSLKNIYKNIGENNVILFNAT